MPKASKPIPAGGGNASAADPKQDRTHKDFEPSQDEQTAVKNWLDRVRRAEDTPRRKAWFDKLDDLRAYTYGTKKKDESTLELTRTNLVFATMAAMMPHLYAKNPDISIAPSAACPQEKLTMIKKFCTTAEAGVGQMFVKEGKLKRRAKANVRSTMTTSYGVLKMVYQKDLHTDPLTLRRIQDTQDNLQKIEVLAKELKEGDDVTTLARQRDELSAQLKGLMSGNEVRVFKGFVIDRVRSEDLLVLDDSIAEFDEYVDAAALGHLVWMTVGKYKAQFGCEPHGATKFNTPFTGKEISTQPEGQTPDDMFVCVVEVWDKDAGVVRTVAKGMNRWCRLPYAPKNTPQRWYPFYILGFNLVEGRWRPISDVELLMGLQDEYNTTRTNYADVRADAVPVRVFRKAGGLTEEDIKTLSTLRRNRDWIGIEGSPTIPLGDDIMQLEGPKIDPNAYDVTIIRNDMDVVVGLSDAGRANLVKPKTATEAEIMNQALGLRVEERRDTNEDMIGDMGEAALEIMLRDMSLEEMKQIAGEDAVWPEMNVQQIFSLIDVSVKAGSSGKPNMVKEREQWTQLLPVITDAMKQVGELRSQGHFDMADAVVDLLRETLRRFQERIDVDSLIPPVEKGQDGKPVQVAQQIQAGVQAQEQLKECQAQFAECEKQLQAAKAGEASKIEQAAKDADVRKAEIAAKERAEQHLAIVNAAAKLLERRTERDREAQRAKAEGRTEDAERAQAGLQASELVGGLKEAMADLTGLVGELIKAGVAGGADRPAA